jgi:hypothetical protein
MGKCDTIYTSIQNFYREFEGVGVDERITLTISVPESMTVCLEHGIIMIRRRKLEDNNMRQNMEEKECKNRELVK